MTIEVEIDSLSAPALESLISDDVMEFVTFLTRPDPSHRASADIFLERLHCSTTPTLPGNLLVHLRETLVSTLVQFILESDTRSDLPDFLRETQSIALSIHLCEKTLDDPEFR